MEVNNGPTILTVLGLLSVIIGFLVGDWLWGSLAFVGISWVIAGAALKFAERDLTEGAFFAGLLLGVVGAILWIVIDISRSNKNYPYRQGDYKQFSDEEYRCGNCLWIGKPGCPRNETLINAEPCPEFKFWTRSD